MNNSNQKTVVIAGDSWACGEWGMDINGDFKILHGGLTRYFTESGYLVVNLGKPGGSNITSADRIDNFLKVSSHLNIEYVFVFQTEWIRDVLLEDKESIKEDVSYGYQNTKNRLMSRFYYKLSRTSQELNKPIHIIGGCSDTIWIDKFSQEYPGLEIICQSLTNLLLNNDHRIVDPVCSLFTIFSEKEIVYLKQFLNKKDLKLMLDDSDQGKKRRDIWQQEKNFFWPDGGHANQNGHYILYTFLKSKIPNL